MSTATLSSEQKSHIWRIPNFAEVLKSEKLLNEQRFNFEMGAVGVHLTSDNTLKWTCFLTANEKNEDHIGLFIVAVNLTPELGIVYSAMGCQVLGKGGSCCFHSDSDTVFSINHFLGANVGCGIPILLPRRVSKNPSFLTDDGSLEIRLTLTVYHHSAVQESEYAAVEAKFECRFASNLRLHLIKLRKYPLNTSGVLSTACKIVAKNGEVFSADRTTLHARSDVFKAMFESGMSEGQGGVVEVKDFDGNSLEVLLDFMHMGKLAKNWKDEGVIEGVVYGAHKYMLKDLMEFLDKILGLVCTNVNCGKPMGLAKAFEMKTAEQRLLEYFKKNLANDMEQVTKFVQDSALAATLMTSTTEEQQENGEDSTPKKRRLNKVAKLN